MAALAAPVFRRGFGGATLELEAPPRFVWEAKRMADDALVQLGVLPPRYGGTSDRVRLVQNDRILDEDNEGIHSQEDIFVVVDVDDVVRGTVAPRGVSWVFEDTGLPVLFDNAPTTIFEARLVLFMQVGGAPVSFKVGETELHDNDVIEENTVVMVSLL